MIADLRKEPRPSSRPDAVSLHVLVAEDDPDLRSLAVHLLSASGHAVVGASDGDEALEVARSMERLDVLFTDIVMPGCGGIELASRLAAQRPGVRAVFTSAFRAPEVTDEIASLGCAFLPKPYSPAELERAVTRARPLATDSTEER